MQCFYTTEDNFYLWRRRLERIWDHSSIKFTLLFSCRRIWFNAEYDFILEQLRLNFSLENLVKLDQITVEFSQLKPLLIQSLKLSEVQVGPDQENI